MATFNETARHSFYFSNYWDAIFEHLFSKGLTTHGDVYGVFAEPAYF